MVFARVIYDLQNAGHIAADCADPNTAAIIQGFVHVEGLPQDEGDQVVIHLPERADGEECQPHQDSPLVVQFQFVKAAEAGVSLTAYAKNCLELEDLDLGQFDHVFLMGPLYHLTDEGSHSCSAPRL